jgi:hypothetical protein
LNRFDSGTLGVAIIWAAVIFATAIALSGTTYFGRLVPILGGGAAASLILLGGCRPKKS